MLGYGKTVSNFPFCSSVMMRHNLIENGKVSIKHFQRSNVFVINRLLDLNWVQWGDINPGWVWWKVDVKSINLSLQWGEMEQSVVSNIMQKRRLLLNVQKGTVDDVSFLDSQNLESQVHQENLPWEILQLHSFLQTFLNVIDFHQFSHFNLLTSQMHLHVPKLEGL